MQYEGIYKKTIFRNHDTGYTIFSFHPNKTDEYCDNYGNLTCMATVLEPAKNTPLLIDGEFKHSRGRIVFMASDVSYPEKKELLIELILSYKFKGIGPAKAKKIIKLFSPDFFAKISDPKAPELLSKYLRIKKEESQEILITLRKSSMQKKLADYLSAYGGSLQEATRIFQQYGELSLEIVKEDPYRLHCEKLIDFYLADRIAKENQISYTNEMRIESLLIEALTKNEKNGNTRCSFSKLKALVKTIEKESAYKEKIPDMMLYITLQKKERFTIAQEQGYYIYKKETYQKEIGIAKELMRLSNTAKRFPFSQSLIDKSQDYSNMLILDNQRQAFDILKSSGVKQLIGGPGTGKTTMLKNFIYAYRKMFPKEKILLCAPTGRAAQKMAEATGHPASTIHKALDFRPYGTEFKTKDKEDPIDADFIIVDESSMVDEATFLLLLRAIKNSALLLLVGDKNQLQSVGCGSVLRDLIESGAIPTYHLHAVFRQAQTSPIISNAQKILMMDTKLMLTDDFRVISCNSEKEAQSILLNEVKRAYANGQKDKLQVLSTTKKGLCGTAALNKEIQSLLFETESKSRFHSGDKIIMTRNNYSIEGSNGYGYFNGDIGTVKEVTEDGILITLGNIYEQNEFLLQGEDIQDMELAYAITTHKAQGSEYEEIIFIVPKNPSILLINNLIYTALTRARKKITVISQQNAFYEAILQKDKSIRDTGLCEKIKVLKNFKKN